MVAEQINTDANDRPPVHILLVDDDPGIIRLLCFKLDACGYVTEEAHSGQDALAAIARRCPDIIVLDISMPEMSGLDVLSKVRSQHPTIGIIMITALGSEEVVLEALRRGADEYLIKPFDLKQFMSTVNRIAARSHGNDQTVATPHCADSQDKSHPL